MATESCNLRCAYCYETFARGRMSRDVADGVVNLIQNRAEGLDLLEVGWFGGEPLAASDIVMDISDRLKVIAQDNDFKVIGNMSTNGYFLNPNIVMKLVNAGTDFFQVSLDGTKDQHDKTRKMANGRGTFLRVWNNLVSLQETDLEFVIVLRMHLHPSNIDDIIDLHSAVEEQFGSDPRFRFHYVPIENYGIEASKDFSVLSVSRASEVIERLRAGHWNQKQVVQVPKSKCYVCYASYANSFVVRSDGRLLKCTLAIEDDASSIGKLLPNGTMEIDAGRVKHWIRGLWTMDEATLACPKSSSTNGP
ncbi:radical SAM protein [Caenispirillum salinarum]|uniref:radical SAM protein n=1 Tax=Caenispirillum salinarum TaxID=859058 RepID=UPI000A031640|nr:radical SAM protein [Caenispirillum salinarum]